MRFRIILVLVLLLAGDFIGLSFISSQPQSVKTLLTPTDDAYILRDFGALTSPVESKNTGSSPVLVTSYSFVTGNHTLAYAYLRFDLSNLNPSTVMNASLNLFISDLAFIATSRQVDVRYVNNSNWSERTLNYQNAPPFEKGIIATTLVSEKDRYYSWDLTDFVSQHASHPVTVMVSLDAVFVNKTEFTAFSSKESATNPPQLVIESVAPPPSLGTVATTSPGYFLTGLIAATILVASVMVLRRRPRLQSTQVCPNCGRGTKSTFKLCPYCGASLSS